MAHLFEVPLVLAAALLGLEMLTATYVSLSLGIGLLAGIIHQASFLIFLDGRWAT